MIKYILSSLFFLLLAFGFYVFQQNGNNQEWLPFQDRQYLESFKDIPFLKKIEGKYSCDNINEAYIVAGQDISKEYCRVIYRNNEKIIFFLMVNNSYAGTSFLTKEVFRISNIGYIHQEYYIEKYPDYIQEKKDYWNENYTLIGDEIKGESVTDANAKVGEFLLRDYIEGASWLQEIFDNFEKQVRKNTERVKSI